MRFSLLSFQSSRNLNNFGKRARCDQGGIRKRRHGYSVQEVY